MSCNATPPLTIQSIQSNPIQSGRVRGVSAREGAQRRAVGADDGQHHRLPHGVPSALRPARREPAVQVPYPKLKDARDISQGTGA